jgi:3-oxoacyl-[acyl-carrier protein] reductase
MNDQLSRDRVALVTGASGWIGGGIARRLAATGVKVAVGYRSNAAAARTVVDEIQAAGGAAMAAAGDFTDATSIAAMIQAIEGQFGPVTILVNNAISKGVPWAPIEEQRWEFYQRHLESCLKAPLLLLQATLPAMKAQRFGRVINIGSEVFDLGDGVNAHYVAAKGAMVGLTRSWATELGPFGVTVNSVVPGWIAREGHGLEGGAPNALLTAYIKGLPVGHVGTPDDIGAAVAYLCSEAAGFVTGQRLSVNGGNTQV